MIVKKSFLNSAIQVHVPSYKIYLTFTFKNVRLQ